MTIIVIFNSNSCKIKTKLMIMIMILWWCSCSWFHYRCNLPRPEVMAFSVRSHRRPGSLGWQRSGLTPGCFQIRQIFRHITCCTFPHLLNPLHLSILKHQFLRLLCKKEGHEHEENKRSNRYISRILLFYLRWAIERPEVDARTRAPARSHQDAAGGLTFADFWVSDKVKWMGA